MSEAVTLPADLPADRVGRECIVNWPNFNGSERAIYLGDYPFGGPRGMVERPHVPQDETCKRRHNGHEVACVRLDWLTWPKAHGGAA